VSEDRLGNPAGGRAPNASRATAFATRGRRLDSGKRKRIIEAASGLFGGRDLASVRMEEVALRARVAKGTVYLYFRSKEDLYFSILATRLSVLLDALDQAFREGEDPRIRLRKFLVHSSMFLLKYPDFFRMLRKERSRLAGAVPGPEDSVELLRARLRNLLRSLLTRGMETGRIRPLPVEMAAEIVFGALEGTVRRCLEEGSTPERHNQAPALLFDFVWRALQPQSDGIATAATPGAAAVVSSRDGRLDGAVIAITREEEPGEGLAAEIIRLGGQPLPIPVLRTEAPEDTEALRTAARAASDYAWVIFTSARGVESFAAAWHEAADGRNFPAATLIATVGPATARRAQELLGRCDYAAAESRGTGLARELTEREVLRGQHLLVARAEEGRPELSEALRGSGAFVDEVVAYRTVPAVIHIAPVRAALHRRSIAAVAFASPSAVKAFVGQVGIAWLAGPEGHAPIATIGPSTTAAVRALGLEPSAEADTPSLPQLARAVVRAVQTRQGVTP
jgi:uroporphyrinogen-III synthase/AcrR family transcriptional regulator